MNRQRRCIATLTVHNRKDLSVRCLTALEVAARVAGAEISAVVVDDGSSDGTAEAIRAQFPWVDLRLGDGSLYWAGGMNLAQNIALGLPHDYILWLNDDVELLPEALGQLLDLSESFADGCIVVGSMIDSSGRDSYGAFMRNGRGPLNLTRVERRDVWQLVDTMHGNCVLVPHAVAATLGPVDARFGHKYADLDYGYRANKVGVKVVLAGFAAGVCEGNDAAPTFDAPGLTLRSRLSRMATVKEVPFGPQFLFAKRHGGALWPLMVISPYVKVIARHLRSSGWRR